MTAVHSGHASHATHPSHLHNQLHQDPHIPHQQPLVNSLYYLEPCTHDCLSKLSPPMTAFGGNVNQSYSSSQMTDHSNCGAISNVESEFFPNSQLYQCSHENSSLLPSPSPHASSPIPSQPQLNLHSQRVHSAGSISNHHLIIGLEHESDHLMQKEKECNDEVATLSPEHPPQLRFSTLQGKISGQREHGSFLANEITHGSIQSVCLVSRPEFSNEDSNIGDQGIELGSKSFERPEIQLQNFSAEVSGLVLRPHCFLESEDDGGDEASGRSENEVDASAIGGLMISPSFQANSTPEKVACANTSNVNMRHQFFNNTHFASNSISRTPSPGDQYENLSIIPSTCSSTSSCSLASSSSFSNSSSFLSATSSCSSLLSSFPPTNTYSFSQSNSLPPPSKLACSCFVAQLSFSETIRPDFHSIANQNERFEKNPTSKHTTYQGLRESSSLAGRVFFSHMENQLASWHRGKSDPFRTGRVPDGEASENNNFGEAETSKNDSKENKDEEISPINSLSSIPWQPTRLSEADQTSRAHTTEAQSTLSSGVLHGPGNKYSVSTMIYTRTNENEQKTSTREEKSKVDVNCVGELEEGDDDEEEEGEEGDEEEGLEVPTIRSTILNGSIKSESLALSKLTGLQAESLSFLRHPHAGNGSFPQEVGFATADFYPSQPSNPLTSLDLTQSSSFPHKLEADQPFIPHGLVEGKLCPDNAFSFTAGFNSMPPCQRNLQPAQFLHMASPTSHQFYSELSDPGQILPQGIIQHGLEGYSQSESRCDFLSLSRSHQGSRVPTPPTIRPLTACSSFDSRDLETFAEKFKQRRIKLGVTQADVGRALGSLKLSGVGCLSQSTICRFESLTLSHNNMVALKPILQAWLDEAGAAASLQQEQEHQVKHYHCQQNQSQNNLQLYQNRNNHHPQPHHSHQQLDSSGKVLSIEGCLACEPGMTLLGNGALSLICNGHNTNQLSRSDTSVSFTERAGVPVCVGTSIGGFDKKRKRTSITDAEKRALEAYFSVQPRPTSERIAQIAERLGLKKNVVRVWFCNQRQKQKRMKFKTQADSVTVTSGLTATLMPSASGTSHSSVLQQLSRQQHRQQLQQQSLLSNGTTGSLYSTETGLTATSTLLILAPEESSHRFVSVTSGSTQNSACIPGLRAESNYVNQSQ